MNYAQYLEKGKTIESTESLIEKVINSQGQDENALQELVNRAQSQDSKAIEFLQMLQQQSGVSKFEEPSGPIVKKDQQDPNIPVAAETGTVDGRKYTYMPYQGEGRGPIDRFEYIGQDGNTYGMTIQGPDTTYVMNGQQYNDPEGQRVIKERRAAVVREKCGGSVKKKETGDKITRKKVMAKGGCPCMIKKVGGRLIEVDSCTDLPVHRNGAAIKKYEKTPGPITYAQQAIEGSNTVENNLTAAISDSFKTGLAPTLQSTGAVGAGKQVLSDGSKSSVVVYKNGFANPVYKELDEQGNETGEAYYNSNFIRLDDGSYVYKDPDTGNQYYNNGRYYDVKTGKTGNYDMFSFFNQTPNNINKLRAAGFVMGPLSTKVQTPATDGDEQGTPKTTWRDTFGAGKSGKFGGLTYDQALARQQEMLNAEWFNANLGTSGATKRGDDGMWGRTSQSEWDRYQSELQARNAQATAAAAAEAERQALNNLQASSIRRTTSDGMTNEALLAMDAGKAMSTLSRPDYERWMKLNQYQQGRNASLVYNGKRYNDEAAYNAAVDAETARTAPQLDMQSLLNIRGKRKRNAAYAQYQASMDKHVANNPLYSGPKALTQEQLSATSFRNGGQLNYANYLN